MESNRGRARAAGAAIGLAAAGVAYWLRGPSGFWPPADDLDELSEEEVDMNPVAPSGGFGGAAAAREEAEQQRPAESSRPPPIPPGGARPAERPEPAARDDALDGLRSFASGAPPEGPISRTAASMSGFMNQDRPPPTATVPFAADDPGSTRRCRWASARRPRSRLDAC
eukprot:9773044-Lingulodinium_polyedra.AAC.1